MVINLNFPEHIFNQKLKILAIFGYYQNPEKEINLTGDKELINKLQNDDKADVKILDAEINTKQEILHAIHQDEYDIFFFAGHSASNINLDDAQLEINDTEVITINNIRTRLRQALTRSSHPLVLAIFNSCDGLGINQKLLKEDIRIPYLIAMGYAINDDQAYNFLDSLLRFFVYEKRSLQESYTMATNILKDDLEDQDPFLDLLPIIFSSKSKLFWYDPEREDQPEQPTIPTVKPPNKLSQFISQLTKPQFWFPLLVIATIFIIRLFQSPPALPNVCNLTSRNMFTCGKISIADFTQGQTQLKNQAMDFYAKYDYKSAVNSFEKAWKEQQTKDPETLIFLNNAKIMRDLQKGIITKAQIRYVVVSIPLADISKPPTNYITKSMLQGAAQKINEFNSDQIRLFVVIANDKNDHEIVKNLAEKLIPYKDDILGIIGFYGSKITTVAQEIFEKKGVKILLISGHTSRKLEGHTDFNNGKEIYPKLKNQNYFFRVTTNTKSSSKVLAKYLAEVKGYKKIATLFHLREAFSVSFYTDFKASWEKEFKGLFIPPLQYDQIKTYYQQNKQDKIIQELKNTQSQGASALMLCPNAFTTTDASTDPQSKMLDFALARQVIQLNNGKLFIAGCNTSMSLYNRLELKALNDETKNNLVAVVPWYPKNNDIPKYSGMWEKESDTDLMRYALEYDAVQLLTAVIDTLMEDKGGKIPTSEEIVKRLDQGFSTSGITGKITIENHERKEQEDIIVKPKCEQQQCEWRRIDEL